MTKYKNSMLIALLLLLPLAGLADNHGPDGQESQSNESAIATQWMEALYTSQDASRRMVEQYMADDGYSYPGRFIGFGFMYDPNSEDRKVTAVIPDSPASSVLRVGDTFVSVNGVEATRENWDNGNLDFAGAPDETVTAVVARDGANEEISFKRGLVTPRYSKDQVLETIAMVDADQWAAEEFEIRETALSRDQKSVYIWSWHRSLNQQLGLSYEENVVTRFRFNDDGLVIAVGDLSEEALVQSQLGFSVSR